MNYQFTQEEMEINRKHLTGISSWSLSYGRPTQTTLAKAATHTKGSHCVGYEY